MKQEERASEVTGVWGRDQQDMSWGTRTHLNLSRGLTLAMMRETGRGGIGGGQAGKGRLLRA